MVDIQDQGLSARDEILQRNAFTVWRKGQKYYRQADEEARMQALEQSSDNWITLRRLVKYWRIWRREYRSAVFENERKNVSSG